MQLSTKQHQCRRLLLISFRIWVFLRTLVLIMRTQIIHSPRHTSSARWALNWTIIGQMAIAIALLGFNDLGLSVTPTFIPERDYIYNHLHIVQKWTKKSMWEVKKHGWPRSKCGHGAREWLSWHEILNSGTFPYRMGSKVNGAAPFSLH